MSRAYRSLRMLCLVGSLVCLSASSYCIADVCIGNGAGHIGPCFLGHFMLTSGAGSYADGTPVCNRWNMSSCFNVYVKAVDDNNGLDAVLITPSITIILSQEVGPQAINKCQDSECNGCPPARAVNNTPDIDGMALTSFRKCCVPVGPTSVTSCPPPPPS